MNIVAVQLSTSCCSNLARNASGIFIAMDQAVLLCVYICIYIYMYIYIYAC